MLSSIKQAISLFILLIITVGTSAFGAENSTNKSQIVSQQYEQFDQGLIEDFKADERFQYIQPPASRPNWLKVMYNKFLEWLISILGPGLAYVVIVVLAIIGLVGLGFAFYGLFGIGKTMPVYSKDEDNIPYSVEEEDIHEINFPEEIELATSLGNYKKAIRLLYLFTLKLLTDQSLIEWSPSKTNHDYIYEIGNESYKSGFSAISVIFEYVWYGDFQADASKFSDMNEIFSGLKKELTNHA